MKDVFNFFMKKFREINDLKQSPMASYYYPRPYRNAAVRLRSCSINNIKDIEERIEILKKTGMNVFFFPAHKIPGCDLLSDSGTTTMTMEQWSQLLLGDEAYGSNEGYFELKKQINTTFGNDWIDEIDIEEKGEQNFFIFHQGRACEYALFSTLSKTLSEQHKNKKLKPLDEDIIKDLPDKLNERLFKAIEESINSGEEGPRFIIPCNTFFDTTEANITSANIIPLNIPCEHYENKNQEYIFKGNIHINDLRTLLDWGSDRIPLIYLTVTNNRSGGLPVSLVNIKETVKIAKEYKIPLFFDACRFAENAWFIKEFESNYKTTPIRIEDIVHEMFEDIDGFHISFKKDGLVNMGGAILIRKGSQFTSKYPKLLNNLTDHQILVEGHPTYGGLPGRDIKGLIEGLKTVTNKEYLNHRIKQVERFGEKLIELLKDPNNESPIEHPIGGHAVYIDMDKFFNGLKDKENEFMGISVTALLLIAGHRLVELGLYAFGKCKNKKESPPCPRVNNVRAAVPRLTYEDQDLFATAEAIKILYDNRDKIPGVNVIDDGQEKTLRHFKSRFNFKV